MAKEIKNIGDVLTDSFKEFKENFKTYLKILIFLSFIPMIIFTIIEVFWLKDIMSLGENTDPTLIVSAFFGPWFIVIALFTIVLVFLGIWMSSSLIYNSIYKKKIMGVGKSLEGGKKYFWKFFGLNLYIFLIFFVPIILLAGIIGLSAYFMTVGAQNYSWALIAIILSAIAFIVYLFFIIYLCIKWVFSPFILIGENKGVMESLRRSKEFVKRKWWITFLYALLIFLIIWVISFVISLPAMIMTMGINLAYYGSTSVSDPESLTSLTGNFNIFLLTTMVSTIFNILAQAITVPLTIFLFKNLYLMRKEEMKM